MANTLTIEYVACMDGWGEVPPSEDDIDSFLELVCFRLGERFPGAQITARMDRHALESEVIVDSRELDEHELETWIGIDIWAEWCVGHRAPVTEVALAIRTSAATSEDFTITPLTARHREALFKVLRAECDDHAGVVHTHEHDWSASVCDGCARHEVDEFSGTTADGSAWCVNLGAAKR